MISDQVDIYLVGFFSMFVLSSFFISLEEAKYHQDEVLLAFLIISFFWPVTFVVFIFFELFQVIIFIRKSTAQRWQEVRRFLSRVSGRS